ncbi:MAG: hypothetical protein PVJ57_06140 [Phycisphaerae bacterium]|jgi:hypothetical protein
MREADWIRQYQGLIALCRCHVATLAGLALLFVSPLVLLDESMDRDLRYVVCVYGLAMGCAFIVMEIMAWVYAASVGQALALGGGPIGPVVGEAKVKKGYERFVWFASHRWLYTLCMTAGGALGIVGVATMYALRSLGVGVTASIAAALAVLFIALLFVLVACLQRCASDIVERLDDLAARLEQQP